MFDSNTGLKSNKKRPLRNNSLEYVLFTSKTKSLKIEYILFT